jgi:heme exporter protein A
MEPALDLRGIAKLYGSSVALRALSLQLPAGEVLALLGPNGSGKTTLLKIVAGALTPTLGEGRVYGHHLVRDRAALRKLTGILAAETYLYDDLTARENLRFILTMRGHRPAAAHLAGALDDVGLGRHMDERVRTFSSGMRRRLALARLTLLAPKLMLLDEPYNSLDTDAADLVDAVVRRAAENGGAVVLATHDAARGLRVAQRVAVLDRGTLRHVGPVHSYAQHVG